MAGYRRAMSDADRAAAAEARQATLDMLHTQLSDGILALNDPQAWQAWLEFSSQFHRYSFGNSLLIMLQDPEATHVAGYQAFKAMGRQVRRGETGIKVLAPITRREPRLDDAGRPVRDDQGRIVHRTLVVATKPVTVFDIRQTDGPPLPDPKIGEAALLTGQAPAGLWDRIQGLLEERGFDVRRRADLGGPNGFTDFGGRLVMVRDDVDDAQAVKTLAHEAGHVLLHQDQGSRDCRGILEVEAESVAYMVTSAHGLDSSQLEDAVAVLDAFHFVKLGRPRSMRSAAGSSRTSTATEAAKTIRNTGSATSCAPDCSTSRTGEGRLEAAFAPDTDMSKSTSPGTAPYNCARSITSPAAPTGAESQSRSLPRSRPARSRRSPASAAP